MTQEQLKELSIHTAGAFEELAVIATIIYGTAKTIKNIASRSSFFNKAKANPKEVNIHGKINSELDEVDLVNKVIYEDKNASKLYMENPDYPQSEMQWAEKQIFKKGANRIEALQQSEFKLSSTESATLPSVEELKNIKEYVFRIDADTPQLRAAVQVQIDKLSKIYPDYTFRATFGGE